MNKIFDKNTVNCIDNFEVDLPKDDWNVLAAKLSKRNRIAPVFWWSVAAGLAILIGIGSVVGFYNNFNRKNLIVQTQNKKYKSQDNLIENSSEQKANEIKSQKYNNSDNLIFKPKNNKSGTEYNQQSVSSSQDNNKTETKLETNPVEYVKQQFKDGEKPENKQISVEEAKRLMEEQQKAIDDKIKNNSQKEDTKQQKKELKEKNSFINNYYAAAYTSASPSGLNLGGSEKFPPRMLISPPINTTQLGTTYTEIKHDLPIAAGLSAGIPLIPHLYLNTGLQYVYLHSKTTYLDNVSNKIISSDDQQLHYIGIPVNVAYMFLDKKIFKMYAAAGGTIEKGIVEKHLHKTFDENEISQSSDKKGIKGVQFSLNANIGASVRLVKGLNFYLEPGVSWYIPAEKYPQPQSKRTINPFIITITGGLRWNFEKK